MKRTKTILKTSLLVIHRSKNNSRRTKACKIPYPIASRIHKDSYVAALVVLKCDRVRSEVSRLLLQAKRAQTAKQVVRTWRWQKLPTSNYFAQTPWLDPQSWLFKDQFLFHKDVGCHPAPQKSCYVINSSSKTLTQKELSLSQKYAINLISRRLEPNLRSSGLIPISRISTPQIKSSWSCQRTEHFFSTSYRANAKSSALGEKLTISVNATWTATSRRISQFRFRSCRCSVSLACT